MPKHRPIPSGNGTFVWHYSLHVRVLSASSLTVPLCKTIHRFHGPLTWVPTFPLISTTPTDTVSPDLFCSRGPYDSFLPHIHVVNCIEWRHTVDGFNWIERIYTLIVLPTLMTGMFKTALTVLASKSDIIGIFHAITEDPQVYTWHGFKSVCNSSSPRDYLFILPTNPPKPLKLRNLFRQHTSDFVESTWGHGTLLDVATGLPTRSTHPSLNICVFLRPASA